MLEEVKVSFAGAWKGTEIGTEFGGVLPGMYLSLISGRIKPVAKHLIHRCIFLCPRNKRTKKYNINQNQAPSATKPAKKQHKIKLLSHHCERYTQTTQGKLL